MTFEEWLIESNRGDLHVGPYTSSGAVVKALRSAFEAGEKNITDARDAGQRFGEIIAGVNDEWKGFGFLLRRYRQAANKSLSDLATEFGYTPQELSDIERGKARPPVLETVKKISSYLEGK
ncbi:hypothetical protein LCGC14_3078250 [marine sediment metagenome]|uniref:HTH cro/C1-type domain-containing protein n=1 Tax=marine sediment metagenome TaxID=412755 RepID=A0A0F8Z4S3_9ZZZZ